MTISNVHYFNLYHGPSGDGYEPGRQHFCRLTNETGDGGPDDNLHLSRAEPLVQVGRAWLC